MTLTPTAGDAAGALRALITGTVTEPADPEYDQARRIWNGMIDPRPALIVRPSTAIDVATAIRFARERDLPIAVRGGGHNVAGLASVDDGLVIDLSSIHGIEIDPIRRTATVGGGVTWGQLDAATQPFGLATPGGVVSDTGIGGLTLGGGMGWLRRRHGLSADNMIGAEVVLADGRIVWTSATQRPELLWGLRGGGGNFGVVTTFEFRLHPIGPEVAFANVLYPLAAAHDVLRGHEQFVAADSAGDISTIAVLGHIPPLDAFDPSLHGAPFAAVLGMFAGPVGPRDDRAPAAPRAGNTARGLQRDDALHRGTDRVRRRLSGGPSLLLEVHAAASAERRRNRCARRPDGGRPVGPLDDRPVAERRADERRAGGGDRVRAARSGLPR